MQGFHHLSTFPLRFIRTDSKKFKTVMRHLDLSILLDDTTKNNLM